MELNNSIFYFFYNLGRRTEAYSQIMIFLADALPYITVILAGLFLIFHHEIMRADNPFKALYQKKIELIEVATTSFLAYFLSVALKIFFHTARPFDAMEGVASLFFQSGYAFPSGHTTFFSALAFSIFFLHKKAGAIFIVLALVIGAARIAAGVHFPVDIFGGFVLGALVAFGTSVLFKRFKAKVIEPPVIRHQ